MSVSIEGLSNAAHLNGTTGVLRMFDQEAGRWRVELPGDGAEIAVRPENLKSLVRCRTASQGPVKPSHQRTPSAGRAAARTFDWMERPPSETSPNSPSPLETGSKVRLEGLVGAAHLNGMFGVLRYFDDQTLRWHVELPCGETKAVRPENLEDLGVRVCGSPTPLGPRRLSREPSDYSLPGVRGYTKGRRYQS